MNPSRFWGLPPAQPRLEPGSVHVWSVDLAATDPEIRDRYTLLSADERARARRFRFARDRRRYIVARGTLRMLVGSYLGRAGKEVCFVSSPGGKPVLLPAPGDPPLYFNLSHSGDGALIALSQLQEIGVDLEELREMPDLDTLAERVFSPAERRELTTATGWRRVEAFFRCWTNKEAVIKATGEGLARPLGSFEVAFNTTSGPWLARMDGDPQPTRWTLGDLRPAEGAIGAFAVRGVVESLHCWRYPARFS